MVGTKRSVYGVVAFAAVAFVLGGKLAVPALAQAAKAVLMRDADNPALGAVQLPLSLQPNNTFHDYYSATYTVPAGKRLVIQRADVADFAGAASPGFVQVAVTFSGAQGVFSASMSGGSGPQFGAVQGPIYADPGSPVSIYYTPGQTSSAATKSGNLTGYLVSYP